MSIEELSELDIINGICTSLFVFIAIIVGLRILLKFTRYKRKEFITVGFGFITISTPWWGNSFSFILYVLFGYRLELFSYLFIENVFIPIALVLWVYSLCLLGYPKIKKKITILFSAISIPYEIFIIISLVINPENIGTLEGMFDSSHTLIPNVFKVFAILSLFLTGILFAKKSISSVYSFTQWKGRFFGLGILLFTIGSFLDVVLSFTPLQLVLVRIILISSISFIYMGFFLPVIIAKRLIKDIYRSLEEPIGDEVNVSDFMRMLTKPHKISDDEIIFYKDRKICLVCKGKVGGFLYMCTKCDALYCGKCARAISELENACWACEEPIDKTKPVKNLKKEVDDKLLGKPQTPKKKKEEIAPIEML